VHPLGGQSGGQKLQLYRARRRADETVHPFLKKPVFQRLAPFPLRFTVCGLPAALSATARASVREPTFVGLKVTEIVQLALGCRELGLLFVWK
jgi:hypothetical protein